jgi:hypothetical protein
VTFKWRKGTSGDAGMIPVFIHFEFEDYDAEYMDKVEGVVNENGEEIEEYVLHKMIPPGKHRYFYTVNFEPYVAKD